jgi:CHAD domain-containing protein
VRFPLLTLGSAHPPQGDFIPPFIGYYLSAGHITVIFPIFNHYLHLPGKHMQDIIVVWQHTMKKKEEKEYFNAEWKDMKTALKAYLETGDQDHLHKFRVEVKRLRAMLILADSAGNKSPLQKAFKPVRQVFKKAGDIRSAYINLELAKEYKVEDDAFVIAQNKQMEDAANAFKLKGEKYTDKLKTTHKTIVDEIKPISDTHINQFYSKHLHRINDSLANLRFDDSLHQCRKWIKILIYNYKLVEPSLQLKLNEDYLHDVQSAIGDWHDNMLAKELFTANELKDAALLARINREHTKLENNIKKLVPNFYSFATTTVEQMVEQLS